MSAYQNFLDFFSVHNGERLDGLSESYFTAMTQEERAMAFDHLLKMVETGGTEESVHGLFLADAKRASPAIKELLKNDKLRDDAGIAAAWNHYRMDPDPSLLNVFIRSLCSTDKRIRAKAAYYAPSDTLTSELISKLEGMIRAETDTLASINAANKLLECYGITRDSVEKEEFSRFYRGLRSNDSSAQEMTFRQLDLLYR